MLGRTNPIQTRSDLGFGQMIDNVPLSTAQRRQKRLAPIIELVHYLNWLKQLTVTLIKAYRSMAK